VIDDGGGISFHIIAEQEQIEARAIKPVAGCLEERSRIHNLVHTLAGSARQETRPVANVCEKELAHSPSLSSQFSVLDGLGETSALQFVDRATEQFSLRINWQIGRSSQPAGLGPRMPRRDVAGRSLA
jgi:hypothetical protein